MKQYIGDGLIFAGLVLFVFACWCISPIIALFTASIILILLGFVVLKTEGN